MTMPVMAIDTISIEEQLAEMARVIAKLTKTVKEKDMQIASFINKVEAQVQNMGNSSQGLNHLSNVASLSMMHHIRIGKFKLRDKQRNLPQWHHYLSNNFRT